MALFVLVANWANTELSLLCAILLTNCEPELYLLTIVLIICPHSSSIKYLWPSKGAPSASSWILPGLEAWPWSLSSTSFTNHTPSTLCPGGFRESQETRNPETTGNRLKKIELSNR